MPKKLAHAGRTILIYFNHSCEGRADSGDVRVVGNESYVETCLKSRSDYPTYAFLEPESISSWSRKPSLWTRPSGPEWPQQHVRYFASTLAVGQGHVFASSASRLRGPSPGIPNEGLHITWKTVGSWLHKPPIWNGKVSYGPCTYRSKAVTTGSLVF